MNITATLLMLTLLISGIAYSMGNRLDRRYVIDKDGVFYKGWSGSSGYFSYLLDDADAHSFTMLENSLYGKDKRLVFYEGKKISGADALTFEPLDNAYSKDKIRGYYRGLPIEPSKGSSFKIIDDDYSTDGHDIFYGNIALEVCSSKRF